MTTSTIDIPAEIAEAVPVLFPERAKSSPLGRLPEPAEMPDIFRYLGVKPEQGINFGFTDGNLVQCCVMSAAYVYKVGHSGLTAAVRTGRRATDLGVNDYFDAGAMRGWDGGEPQSTHIDYLAGHAWGKAAWEACVAAGLTTDLAVIDEEVS